MIQKDFIMTEHNNFKRALWDLKAIGEELVPCSYCGHKYNVISIQAFEAHVLVCLKHPFAAAKKTVENLEDELDEKNTFLRIRGNNENTG